MSFLRSLGGFLLLLATLAVAHAYEPPTPQHPVEVLRYEWHDDARNRDVPVKIYLPKDLTQPEPVIVFSHGLGGTREGYEYLGQYWAGCGYISVHVQHAGSDDHVWKDTDAADRFGAMKRATMNPMNVANRPKDISFAIDRLLALNGDSSSPLHGRIDAQKIGVSGHSFGGFTTMAIAGQHFGIVDWTDPRVKAAISMSAPAARPEQINHAYSSIKIPVFHMTGTRDDSPIGETKAADRRIGFDHMTGAETCLLTFQDGDHRVFSGAPRTTDAERQRDANFQKLICAGSTAFWDAWLRGNQDAHTWLMSGAFAHQLGAAGKFETKNVGR